ncbi:GNAT family N-acetyltransferase [Sphaerotilus mobilis]|uniref:Acetyltransferase (GNAT) family protein n=1 Tax=Sphaerotilus mobilis TaxID=47994 RepID=A0A4Q7LB63_9BURK|nr:GNAT family N-acetyltransferase [Sphaerotilus mobilis]RZS47395.1 acetyltransferase (GNAT) family protein [Sphaerotilus mobilis]
MSFFRSLLTGRTEAPRPTVPARRRRLWRFVPIRRLTERHRPGVLKHLLALDGHDRYLRFGYTASDERIVAFVGAIDFQRNELFGIFNRRLQLVATSQLARLEAEALGWDVPADDVMPPAPEPMIEFAVSVSRHVRGRGYGERLFAHAARHARNQGVHRLMIHALSENTAMLSIARKAGARVQREGGESEAWLALPPHSVASQVEELIADRLSALNYRLKQQARQIGWALTLVTEVRRLYARRRVIASQ